VKTLVPAAGNAEANVRITHRTVEDIPFVGMIKQCEVPVLDDIVWTQNLLPAKFAVRNSVYVCRPMCRFGRRHWVTPVASIVVSGVRACL